MEQSGPFCVECVVYYGQVEHSALVFSSKESADYSVEFSTDFVPGVYDLLPPHATDEENRDDDEGSQQNGS